MTLKHLQKEKKAVIIIMCKTFISTRNFPVYLIALTTVAQVFTLLVN